MKMTKIAFWRKVKENCESDSMRACLDINCKDCPYRRTNGRRTEECVIVEKIEAPKGEALALAESYIKRHEAKSKKKPKTVGIDNSDVTIATVKKNLTVPCEHLNKNMCANAFEPCEKDCPANSEYPDPIRVDIPDIFYCPAPQGILRFKRSQIILKDTNSEDCLLKLHDEYPCYRTLEEAVIVAKKLWGVK